MTNVTLASPLLGQPSREVAAPAESDTEAGPFSTPPVWTDPLAVTPPDLSPTASPMRAVLIGRVETWSATDCPSWSLESWS